MLGAFEARTSKPQRPRPVVPIARVAARHSLVFPRPTHSFRSDAVDAAEKHRIKRI